MNKTDETIIRRLCWLHLMTHYFVNRINYIPHEPSACMNCGKNNIVKNIVIAHTGPDVQNITPKDSLLCTDCKTLMVITDEPKKVVTIKLANPGVDEVTLPSSGKA